MSPLFKLFDHYEIHDDLKWRFDEDDSLRFYIVVNDGQASDTIDITEEDVPDLARAMRHCQETGVPGATGWATLLFACRKERRKPEKLPPSKEIANLFSGCGRLSKTTDVFKVEGALGVYSAEWGSVDPRDILDAALGVMAPVVDPKETGSYVGWVIESDDEEFWRLRSPHGQKVRISLR